MASEKQIAANRANAKKSTGPKSPAGKLKSSQNAFRHGLSSPLPLTPEAAAKAASLVQAIVEEEGDEQALKFAAEFALAHLESERVRKTREELMASMPIDRSEIRTLKRIAALDRYDRYAFAKSRQALRKLQSPSCGAEGTSLGSRICQNEPN